MKFSIRTEKMHSRSFLLIFTLMKKLFFFSLFLTILPLVISWNSSKKLVSNENNVIVKGSQTIAKHHIIVVIDGPRWTETYGDTTYKYIPNLGNVLKKEGTLFTNFRNGGPTYTNSGHTAICTGVHQRISNTGAQLPKNPSIFQYLLKDKNLDKRKAWILSSKGKLEMLANTKKKDWWNEYMPSTYCGVNGSGVGYPSDIRNWETYKSIIQENQPVLTLINLLDVDVWGHQNNWERYIESHLVSDSLVMDLWNMIQTNPDLKDKTNLYITNDHGRHLDGHKDGFKSHGDGCEGCRHISLLAVGPDFNKNVEVSKPYDQVDLTASIATMLGLTMPKSKGCIIPELVYAKKKEN